MALQLPAVSQS